jgi:septum formation inhibitor MinC
MGALQTLRNPKQVAELRGLTVPEVLGLDGKQDAEAAPTEAEAEAPAGAEGTAAAATDGTEAAATEETPA